MPSVMNLLKEENNMKENELLFYFVKKTGSSKCFDMDKCVRCNDNAKYS